MIYLDVECYPNYFLVITCDNGYFSKHDSPEDRAALRHIMNNNETVSFNGNRYDLAMIAAWLSGAEPATLYKLSMSIIELGQKQLGHSNWRHIDLIEVAPGVAASLKLYAGRMHSPTMRDLPYPPNQPLTTAQIDEVRRYCVNDVRVLMQLADQLKGQIELRRAIGQQYSINVMSRSDAQIAEDILCHELKHTARPPVIDAGTQYRYHAPEWLHYETPHLRQLLDDVLAAQFTVSDKGGITMPACLDGRTVTIGDGAYRLGIGGLHSSETRTTHRAGEHLLIDCDVASYYPSIILNSKLTPPQFGEKFLVVYGSIVSRRLAAKASSDKVTADALKITVNGSFGKLGSKYSRLYAPELFFHVTVTGQLALLMLIEHLHQIGIPVVSGNTDGIVSMPTPAQLPTLRSAIALWESLTGYTMEETHYSALHCRDVNNYLAVKTDGKVKTKGVFGSGGLMKNPQMEIIPRAAIAYLTHSTPIAETVHTAKPHEIVSVRTVRGGATWGGEPVGKVVRWYWSNIGQPMHYASNGNKVPQSDWCRPAMELPTTIPTDIDWERYIMAAKQLVTDVGVKL